MKYKQLNQFENILYKNNKNCNISQLHTIINRKKKLKINATTHPLYYTKKHSYTYTHTQLVFCTYIIDTNNTVHYLIKQQNKILK